MTSCKAVVEIASGCDSRLIWKALICKCNCSSGPTNKEKQNWSFHVNCQLFSIRQVIIGKVVEPTVAQLRICFPSNLAYFFLPMRSAQPYLESTGLWLMAQREGPQTPFMFSLWRSNSLMLKYKPCPLIPATTNISIWNSYHSASVSLAFLSSISGNEGVEWCLSQRSLLTTQYFKHCRLMCSFTSSCQPILSRAKCLVRLDDFYSFHVGIVDCSPIIEIVPSFATVIISVQPIMFHSNIISLVHV